MRESCHPGLAASPLPAGSSRSILGFGAPSAAARCTLQATARVTRTKVQLRAAAPWQLVGSPCPVSTVPWAGSRASGAGGLQGSLAPAAAWPCLCSLPGKSSRLVSHVAVLPAGPCRGRRDTAAGTGAAVTLLGDSVAWELSGCRCCWWHMTAACWRWFAPRENQRAALPGKGPFRGVSDGVAGPCCGRSRRRRPARLEFWGRPLVNAPRDEGRITAHQLGC